MIVHVMFLISSYCGMNKEQKYTVVRQNEVGKKMYYDEYYVKHTLENQSDNNT